MRDLLRALNAKDPLALLALSQCSSPEQCAVVVAAACLAHKVAPIPAVSIAEHQLLFPPTPSSLCVPPPLAGGRADEVSVAASLRALVDRRRRTNAVNM